jgi:hypothetical protein
MTEWWLAENTHRLMWDLNHNIELIYPTLKCWRRKSTCSHEVCTVCILQTNRCKGQKGTIRHFFLVSRSFLKNSQHNLFLFLTLLCMLYLHSTL